MISKYLIFFFFKYVLLLSALLVIINSNPINAILALILCFLNAAAIFLIFEAEFLALIFIVVYVGAIAVLFLFVIMMINIRLIETIEKGLGYFPFSIILGLIFILELSTLTINFSNIASYSYYYSWINILNSGSNIELLGQSLYGFYIHLFIFAGFILLLAMISAITLTLGNINKFSKFQKIFHQTNVQF